MSDIQIRPARVQDAAELARLDNVASHGLSEWYWRQQATNAERTNADNWLRLSQAAMARSDYLPGWSNTIIAEADGEIVGAASGVLTNAGGDEIAVDSVALFEPIFELFHQAAGDWLLDWLAVDETAQGQGVGGSLLDNCISKAKMSGASQASLVVEDSNLSALQLYHSRGFRKRDQRPYIPFNETSQTQNWLLLSAPVT
ncbi:MAG: GNAT family N-acetyltransferase [Rhizobiaceae bacterium]